MKTIILILMMCFLFTGCEQEEPNQQDVITEYATVTYFGVDPGFGGYSCLFFFKTENNNFYTVENLNSLEEDLKKNNLKIKISFIKTDITINCSLWDTLNTTIVQIKAFEKM